MHPERPHILVIDDDNRLRELLRKYLAENGFRVTTASDAVDARAKIASLTFDLLVLDVMMPGESGLALTESLRERSAVPILMLTAMGESEDRIAGLERGVDDYLPKPFEPRELVLRIQTILRRVPPPSVQPSTVALGIYRFDLTRDELRCGDQLVRLSASEARLLNHLAQNAGLPLSRHSLTRELGLDGGGRTIDVQVARLRRKFEPDPKYPRYLRTVRGKGYVLQPD